MSVRVSLIERIAHNFPFTAPFTTPDGKVLTSEKERLDWWVADTKKKFSMIPAHPRSRYRRNNGDDYLNEFGGRTFGDRGSFSESELTSSLRGRLRNYTGKPGMRVFEQDEGFYEVEIVDSSVITRQEARLQRFCELLSNSQYGLIDPLTRDEAIVDTDYGDKLSYSFMGGRTNPTNITYNVLEASLPELIMTDTLLDSHLMKQISDMVVLNGTLPEIQPLFISVMKAGETDPVLALARADAGGIRAKLSELLEQVSGYDDIQSWAENYEAEEPQFSGEAQLEKKTKTLTVKQFLSLPFRNSTIKKELNEIRPPMTGLKAGSAWPVSTAGKYVLQLTTEPSCILTKSSNRAWDSNSCESLDGGGYSNGCWSDIKFGNAIILIYRYEDLINEEGQIQMDSETILKCQGRFMLRWGDGKDSSGNNIGARIGIERSTYMVEGKNTSLASTLGEGVVTILENRGLWDFKTVYTPYSYRGYSDIRGGSGNITYGKTAFGVKKGGEMGAASGAGTIPNYADMDTMTFAEFQRIIDTNDSDEIRIAVAENPMIWMVSSGSPRIVGNLMRRIWGFYEAENRKTLIQMLLQHSHASPEVLMDMVDSLDAIDPDYATMSESNVLMTFMRHPRTNREIHEKLRDLLLSSGGEDLLYRFYLRADSQYPIYLPADMWTPVVDYMLSDDVSDDFLRAFREENQEQMENKGITDAQVMAVRILINQLTMNEADYERCFSWWVSKGFELEREQNSDLSPLYTTLSRGFIFSLENYDDAGWMEFYGGPNNQFRQTNFTYRTKEAVMAYLSAYQSFEENISREAFINAFYLIAVTAKSGEDLQPLYDFAMSLSDVELRSLILPALTLRPLGRKMLKPLKAHKQGFLPSQAYVPLIEAMMESEEGEFALELLFVSSFKMDRPSVGINGVKPYEDMISYMDFESDNFNPSFDLSSVSGVKMRGTDAEKHLPADASFAILTNPTSLEIVNLKRVASTLAPVDDLFYIMEEIVFTTMLKELYTPEGEKPFAILSPEEFNDFQINLTLSNALPRIFDMWEGLLENQSTPPEIMERLIQKPRLDSVGYRRMFDYYGVSENPMGSNSEEWFASNYLDMVSKNKGISGRLLRYLWSNYPTYHETLLMNPNLVDSRLYGTAVEEFPLQVLKNDEVGSRAYRRHIRKIVEGILMSPPSQRSDRSFRDFSDRVRSYLRDSSVGGYRQFYRIREAQEQNLQFIRAGRYRYSSGLQTAPDGPNSFNLSRTGSIIEYPQVPTDKPFMIFKSYLAEGLWDEVVSENTTFEEFMRNTTPITRNPAPENSEGVRESLDAQFANHEESGVYGTQIQSLSWILDAKRPTSEETYYVGSMLTGEALLEKSVEVCGFEIGYVNSVPGSNPLIRQSSMVNFANSIFENDEKRMQLLDELRVGLEHSNDGGSTLEVFLNEYDLITEFTDEGSITLEVNTAKDSELTIERIRSLRDGFSALLLPRIAELIQRSMLNCFNNGNVAYLRLHFQDDSRLDEPRYNLETKFGWIPPEERTELRNFALDEGVVVLRDSLSIFKPDTVFLLTTDGLRYATPVPEGLEEIPEWRFGFSANQFIEFLENIMSAKNLSYMERVGIVRDLAESIKENGSTLNLFPSISSDYGVDYKEQVSRIYGSSNRRWLKKIMTGLSPLKDTNGTMFPKGKITDEMRDYAIVSALASAREQMWTGNTWNELYAFIEEVLTETLYSDDDWSNGLITELLAMDEADQTMTYRESVKRLVRRFRPYLRQFMKQEDLMNYFYSPAGEISKDKDNGEAIILFAVVRFIYPSLMKSYVKYLKNEAFLEAEDLMLAVRFINFQPPNDLVSRDTPFGRRFSDLYGSSAQNMIGELMTPIGTITEMKNIRNDNYLAFIRALDLVRGTPPE